MKRVGKPLVTSRRYASPDQAADYYQVDQRTLRRWIAEGIIIGYRVGPTLIRIDLNETDAQFERITPSAPKTTTSAEILATRVTPQVRARREVEAAAAAGAAGGDPA